MDVRQRAGVCLIASVGLLAGLAQLPVTPPDLAWFRAGGAAHGTPGAPGTAAADPRSAAEDPLVVGTPQYARAVDASGTTAGQIPAPALTAYLRAVQVLAEVRPGCRLGWPLVAAIGRVESDHGNAGRAQLHADGASTPTLTGPALDGRGGVRAVPDTDGGRIDGDLTWDRAVGPMQIVPATWNLIGVDGDGDGVRSIADLDDAALAVGVHLCSAGVALDTRRGMRVALQRYNSAPAYADLVLSYEALYRAAEAVTAAATPPATLATQAAPAVVAQARARTTRLARHPAAVARASNAHPVLDSAHAQPQVQALPAETRALEAEPTAGPTDQPSSPLLASAPGDDSSAASAGTSEAAAGTSSPAPQAGEATTSEETSSTDPTPDPSLDPTPDATAASTPDPAPDPAVDTAPAPSATDCPVDASPSTDPVPVPEPDPSTSLVPCPTASSSTDPSPTADGLTTPGDASLSPSSPAAP